MLALPKLSAGAQDARFFDDVANFMRYLNEWRYSPAIVQKYSAVEKFNGMANCSAIGDLSVTSFSSTPFSESFKLKSGLVFLIPQQGKVKLTTEHGDLELVGGKSGAILAHGHFFVDYGRVSMLRFDIRNNYLLGTADARSVGADSSDDMPCILRLDLTKATTTKQRLLVTIADCILGGEDLGQNRSLSNVSNALEGLIRSIYGSCITADTNTIEGDLGRGDEGIQLIAEAILADLGQPLSLREMEIISGLSRRTIQYGFLRRFGCPPITWQLRERLTAAYSSLQDSRKRKKVTDIALDFGFASSSTFSIYFKKHFGVTPSEVRATPRPLKLEAVSSLRRAEDPHVF